MASPTASRRARDSGDAGDAPEHGHGLPRALALTLASALVWGAAHLSTGRRWAGGLLVGLFALVVATLMAAALFFRDDLVHLAVRPDWLSGISAGIVLLGLVWLAVVIRSYQLVRPAGLTLSARAAGVMAVAVLCAAVAVPTAWAARSTYLYRDALTSIFHAGGGNGRKIDADDPWAGQKRVNVLLLGGDAAANREGVRTDSMTLASVDTRTGDTVLLSLPRNLEHFQLPPGPARDRFPYGFTGDGPETPGLLNEVYQYAEEHPDIVPGVPKNHRGPDLLKRTVAGILGQPVDYYILVDMFGFADIIDAIGGVKIRITQPIPYGRDGGVLQPGYRTLGGKDALWYGRSRTDSDDYTRMGRQKCLMRAIAKQADPQTVLRKFDKLAAATKRAISTDLPQELLPALMTLSEKVKDGAQINSLAFVPPLVITGNPDFALIRRLAAKAVAEDAHKGAASPSPSASPSAAATAASGTGQGGTPTPGTTPQRANEGTKPVSLESSCPS
ncbi:LCP family protein [Actinomadura macrotermitis]|uniref:Transcriptional regulator LytR n=1 Tax=Actinomadura macrotermitis TaxID=2585200 RepID=A0A7K0C6Z9_9ACTN|nr:LCP family protein [Actinomadura macrotermitis]MQY09188.1 Transcriptional regulator LytR [Actinomadura macrotermitis]